MNKHKEIIERFFEEFKRRDFFQMKNFCTEDIYYFDPLYNLLRGEDLYMMWQLEYGQSNSFQLQKGEIKDEGDGYYVVDLQIEHDAPKKIAQKIKAYLRIEDDKISEYSSAFSIHNLCKQRYGLIGNLLGWNRLYQNRIKNDARSKFIQMKKSLVTA